MQLAIGADKTLLAEVSRVFGIAAVAERKAVEASLPTPYQDIERLVLASPETQDEIGVAHVPYETRTEHKKFYARRILAKKVVGSLESLTSFTR